MFKSIWTHCSIQKYFPSLRRDSNPADGIQQHAAHIPAWGPTRHKCVHVASHGQTQEYYVMHNTIP